MKVLAGDLGGTKTLLRLVECAAPGLAGGYRVLTERQYDSQAYPDFLPIAEHFLAHSGYPTLAAGCLGVAGPVKVLEDGSQQSRLTNLPWHLDSRALAERLGLPRLRLINDFQANGYGIPALGEQDLAVLQAGQPQARAPKAIIGAGTGLGVGLLFWQQDHYLVHSTEGGHVGFSPQSEEQLRLQAFLLDKYGRVSAERVVSGAGLVDIFEFVVGDSGGEPSAALRKAMAVGDAAAAISMFALEERDALARRALDVFVAAYGAQAGDLALGTLPYGGLYLAGGIAPKILPHLQLGPFLEAFRAKGRMSHLVAAVPVYVILNPDVGILGAAVAASLLPAGGAVAPPPSLG